MNRKEWLAAFQSFKRMGIKLTNEEEVVKDNPNYERERLCRMDKRNLLRVLRVKASYVTGIGPNT